MGVLTINPKYDSAVYECKGCTGEIYRGLYRLIVAYLLEFDKTTANKFERGFAKQRCQNTEKRRRVVTK